MDNPRDQQPIVSGPPVASHQAAPATYTVTPPSAPSKPGRWLVFRRGLRLMLRRTLYLAARVLRPLRPIAGFVVVVVALLGLISWLAFSLWGPRSAGEVSDTRAPLLAPSASVENYIKGQQNYNAELMWASLSTDSQASQLNGGASKETLQTRIDRKKENGLRFNRYEYVGGSKLEDGGSMYVYFVDVQAQNQRAKLPMTFLVDADGKIETILDSTSILSDLSLPNN